LFGQALAAALDAALKILDGLEAPATAAGFEIGRRREPGALPSPQSYD
jgi:hypothetical protein